jgi:hypothetical protein
MENSLPDPDLAAIIESWAELPERVKDAVRALVLRSRP